MTEPISEFQRGSPEEAAQQCGPGPDLDALFARVSSGDREATAKLAMAYGPVIRRRVTGKMGPRLRRLFDSEDILSTVLRRLDRYVQDGNLRVASQPQFLALLREICEAAVVDKARVMRRLERVEREDSPLATALRGRLEQRDESGADGDETLAAAFGALADETDRRILWHWLSGREHGTTAELVGMTPAAVRQRWKRIRERVRHAIERSAA